MSHRLTLELPDEIYRPLAEQARATGQSVEAVAQARLAVAPDRAIATGPAGADSAIGRGNRLIEAGRRSQAAISAASREVFAKMGIPETPPCTPEEVQQMMLAEGIRPEDNLFSRGIAEMREE